MLNWHDCKLPGKNIEEPSDCKPYNANDNRRKNSKKELVKLFNRAVTKIHKDDYDLSILYHDSLKRTAKQYGPNSPEVREELQAIDEVLQGRLSDIKNKKERADLKLNVLLISDYGLNGVNKTTKVVLDDYLNFDHVQYIIQRGGSTVLVPYALKVGRFKRFVSLLHFQAGDIMAGVGSKLGVANMVGIFAYVRDINLEVPQLNYPEIPDELKYGGLQWTQDILLVAKPGFQIHIEEDSTKIFPPLKYVPFVLIFKETFLSNQFDINLFTNKISLIPAPTSERVATTRSLPHRTSSRAAPSTRRRRCAPGRPRRSSSTTSSPIR